MSERKPFEVTTSVPFDRVVDLLTCSLQGCTYWAARGEWLLCGAALRSSTRGRRLDAPDGICIEQMLQGELQLDVTLRDSGKIETLNRQKVGEGLVRLQALHPLLFGGFLAANEDAVTGDVFLQLCLFGEVVYS